MFVLGDSHADAIVAASKLDKLRIVGGMLDSGRNLNIDFYDRTPDDFVFRKQDVDRKYRGYLRDAGAACLSRLDMPILCLFGMNIHYLSRAKVWSGFVVDGAGCGRHVSASVLRHTVRAMISGALQFYRDLIGLGLDVYSALPPRRLSASAAAAVHPVFRAIEDVLIDELAAIGVLVADHRTASLDSDGRLRAELAHPDPSDDVHGNSDFGRLVLKEVARLSLEAGQKRERCVDAGGPRSDIHTLDVRR